MTRGAWYEMDRNNWFFLPDDGSPGHAFYCDDPVDLVLEPDRIDWSAALDAYFTERGV